MRAPHCADDIAPVPESVSRSISTSSAAILKTLWWARASAAIRSSRVVNFQVSTDLIRNGSMIVWNGCISDPKSVPQGIALVDDEGVLAGDPGRAFDLRHDRGMLAHFGARCHPAVEARPNQALVHEGPLGPQQSHRVDDRHHRG